MRTVIGWMAAMLASALLGAAVYQTVLSKPSPQLDPTATVETISRDPSPGPTQYRTEVRTVVEPTPTVTIDDEVFIEEEVVQVSGPRTSRPAPARTSAPRPAARPSEDREEDDSAERDDEAEKTTEESDDVAEKAEDEAENEAEDEAENEAENEAQESDD